MTKIERNKLAMYHAVDAVLGKHKQTIDTIVPLAGSVTEFREKLDTIISRDREYEGSTAGATAAKNSAVDTMSELTFLIANALYSFGRKTANEELKAACRISASDFDRLREIEIERFCTRILLFAQTYAANLTGYGITDENIASLRQNLDLYRLQADNKNSRFANSKATREALFSLFDASDEILREDLDRLMVLIKNSTPECFNEYFAARTIKDLGGSIKAKNGKIEDAIIVTEEKKEEKAGQQR